MATPVVNVADRVTFNQASAVTTWTAFAGPPNIAADNIIFAVVGMNGNGNVGLSGMGLTWTELVDIAGGGNALHIAVYWARAAGGETGNITITSSLANGGGVVVDRISGVDPATAPVAATATGDSTNPNPPTLNPAGWATPEETLWAACAANDNGGVAITAGPSGYSNFVNERWNNANGAGMAVAYIGTTADSEDPGTFTMTTEQWAAATVAFRPAAGGAISETPTPGGATAAGTGPSAVVAAAVGGGTGAGTAPTARASVTPGGATAAGNNPTAEATVTPTPGGALAGGNGAGASTGSGTGGGTSAGAGPTAVAAVTPGGALAGGVAPSDSSAVSETPTPGGGTAAGTPPAARADVALGGGQAAGTGPTARAVAGTGGATAAGLGPVVSALIAAGGAAGGGNGPVARVAVSVGGALAGGQLADPLVGAIVIPRTRLPSTVSALERVTGTAGSVRTTSAVTVSYVTTVSGQSRSTGAPGPVRSSGVSGSRITAPATSTRTTSTQGD